LIFALLFLAVSRFKEDMHDEGAEDMTDDSKNVKFYA
jgi:hypothetical protein